MPIDGISFRTLPFAECAERVSAFRNSQREAQRDAGYFDWRYVRRPTGRPAHVTLGCDAQGAVVAAASCIPHEFRVAGMVCTAGMVGDISVDARLRGRGVAAQLLAELRSAALANGLDACFVLPNKEVTGALTRAGFTSVGTIQRAVRMVSVLEPLRARGGAVGGVVGTVLDAALAAGEAFTEGKPPATFATGTAARFDARYDELWQRLPRAEVALARRDAAWLTWRFIDKPGAVYRIFELTRGGTLAGYVVYHLEESRLWVDDFLAADADAALWLGRSFAHQVRAARLAASIHVRYVEQGGLPIPWRGLRYVARSDTQAVMWASSARVPQARHWFVTPADKDV